MLADITQRQLARTLGISEPCLCRLLQGKRNLSWKLAKEWAERLRTRPSILMDAEPAKLKKLLLERGGDLIN